MASNEFERLKREALRAVDRVDPPKPVDRPTTIEQSPAEKNPGMDSKQCKACAMSIPKAAKVCPFCRKKQGWTLPAKIAAGFFVFMVLGAAMNSGKPTQISGAPSAPRIQSPLEAAIASVKLDYDWKKTGFDNVMEAMFTINNKSAYAIKDITIKCTHFAKSGTAVDSNSRTIYDIVQANSTKTIDKFNMGFIHSQAQSTACEIIDLKIN